MRKVPAVLMVMLLLVTPGLYGQQPTELQLPGQGDVRIIVDISGSMKTNDPNNLRQPAVRLLARMIPDGAKAGVWTFGQWVNMLVPHGEVNEAWRENAITQSRKINSVALRTNLGEAIEKASDPYLSGQDLSGTDFILLTDGKVDLADDAQVNAAERKRILGPLLNGLMDRGATLHTVALSEEADLEMLEAIAVDSEGHFSLAKTAEGLNRAFLKALNAAVPQDQIPLDEEGFRVDSGVEEFTALIFWGEEETSATRSLELIEPAGRAFSKNEVAANMRWAAETGYDLITVTDPEPGKWQVEGELGEGSRVTVVSDLRMVVSPVPPSFTADESIALSIAFFEEDSRIENPDFLKVIDVIVRLTSGDGRSGSKILSKNSPPKDGIYKDDIASLPAAGDYDLEVIADGTTFSRRFSAVTRFIAPESSDPQPAPEAAEPEPEPEKQTEPDAVIEEPAMEPAAQAEMPEAGPIDISDVEEPSIAEEPEEKAPEPEAESATPLWIWGVGGALVVLLIGGGLWFWSRRGKADNDEAPEESPSVITEAEPEESEPEESEPEETEPEPEEDEEIPELDESAEEPVEQVQEEAEPEDTEAPQDSNDEPEQDEDEEIPELEPESESEPEAETEPEPEPEPDPEAETESEPVSDDEAKEAEDDDDDDDEFGLEDFDLSEFDDVSEDKPDSDEDGDDPKKGA